jgi:NADPH:quinone reductase-like Zn-dependent oxidoreductase
MKSLWVTAFGGLEKLQIRESPDPSPGAGGVVIDVERAGLNFADIAGRVGLYPDAPKPPMVMGYEVAGRVTAVGAQATAWSRCRDSAATPIGSGSTLHR